MAKKLQIEFSDKSMGELERLKAGTDATSYAQVLRTAVRIYSWCMEHQQQNRKIYAKDANGQVIYELLLP
ncbi:hypothetical protein [Numidum massiliense]|uniref:hypothetical protein n=1 Tax=Numidum massiliense TaxID=1522315 RepID=UPI0006D58FD8|nr:hypothetical protein [Numidum massiliense]